MKIQITMFYYIVNNGDGSASPRFFPNESERDDFMKKEEEEWGQCFTDAYGKKDFLVYEDGRWEQV